MTIRSRKLLFAARDEACTWPGCHTADGTIVAAHSNMLIHGRGHAKKADDIYIAFLCFHHHQLYDFGKDMNRDEKEHYFMRAMSATWRRLFQKGVLKVA